MNGENDKADSQLVNAFEKKDVKVAMQDVKLCLSGSGGRKKGSHRELHRPPRTGPLSEQPPLPAIQAAAGYQANSQGALR